MILHNWALFWCCCCCLIASFWESTMPSDRGCCCFCCVFMIIAMAWSRFDLFHKKNKRNRFKFGLIKKNGSIDWLGLLRVSAMSYKALLGSVAVAVLILFRYMECSGTGPVFWCCCCCSCWSLATLLLFFVSQTLVPNGQPMLVIILSARKMKFNICLWLTELLELLFFSWHLVFDSVIAAVVKR